MIILGRSPTKLVLAIPPILVVPSINILVCIPLNMFDDLGKVIIFVSAEKVRKNPCEGLSISGKKLEIVLYNRNLMSERYHLRKVLPLYIEGIPIFSSNFQ